MIVQKMKNKYDPQQSTTTTEVQYKLNKIRCVMMAKDTYRQQSYTTVQFSKKKIKKNLENKQILGKNTSNLRKTMEEQNNGNTSLEQKIKGS